MIYETDGYAFTLDEQSLIYFDSFTNDSSLTWSLQNESGKLLSRRVNVPWLIREFSQHGVELVQRSPGQFTEAYTRVSSSWINRLIHEFNFLWYRRVKLAGPACGNMLYFQKR